MFAFLRLCELCTHKLSSASSRTALHGNGKLATSHNSTLRPGAQGRAALPFAVYTSQVASLTQNMPSLQSGHWFKLYLEEAPLSPLIHKSKKFSIWPIPITSLGIILSQWYLLKALHGTFTMLIQHQNNSTTL